MQHHRYTTKGTCSAFIDFDTEGGKVYNVKFTGGCNGNLKAISKLVDGMDEDKLIEMLAGNTCGFKPTSCADQLAKAVAAAKNEE